MKDLKFLFISFILLLISIYFVYYHLMIINNNELFSDNKESKLKIGFFLMGTGFYVELVDQLIKSMEKYFCLNRSIEVHYIIFTDNLSYKPVILNNKKYRKFKIVQQTKLKWPHSTLLRFNIVRNQTELLDFKSFNYLYWLDVDMKMNDFICEEILGDLVGTSHSHYPSSNKEYPYENNIKSTAYVDQNNRYEQPYYVGAFYGGNSLEMIKLLKTCDENIQKDFKNLNGFIARVHDESHLNRYNNK